MSVIFFFLICACVKTLTLFTSIMVFLYKKSCRILGVTTLLKVIAIRKCAYLNLIVYSPKCPQHWNTKRVDGCDQPPICQSMGFEPVILTLISFVGP